jgi:hypothetical protein
MKFLAILAVFILLCLAVKMCSGDKSNSPFEKAVEKQPVLFKVPNDKADAVWKRAPEYLQKMKHLVAGGPAQQNDTMIFVPYLPGLNFNKGNSIKVTRSIDKDSTLFSTAWFYYDDPDSLSAREMAYYMLTGIDRYDQ